MDRYRGLLERYVELYNAGDLDGVMDLYAEDVEMPGMEFVTVRDGKIAVGNLYYDNLAVATQFGLLPQPATTS
jgi:ketosteroid isomerase-like protein